MVTGKIQQVLLERERVFRFLIQVAADCGKEQRWEIATYLAVQKGRLYHEEPCNACQVEIASWAA